MFENFNVDLDALSSYLLNWEYNEIPIPEDINEEISKVMNEYYNADDSSKSLKDICIMMKLLKFDWNKSNFSGMRYFDIDDKEYFLYVIEQFNMFWGKIFSQSNISVFTKVTSENLEEVLNNYGYIINSSINSLDWNSLLEVIKKICVGIDLFNNNITKFKSLGIIKRIAFIRSDFVIDECWFQIFANSDDVETLRNVCEVLITYCQNINNMNIFDRDVRIEYKALLSSLQSELNDEKYRSV